MKYEVAQNSSTELVKMRGSSLRASATLNWGSCSPTPWPALLTIPTSSAFPLLLWLM